MRYDHEWEMSHAKMKAAEAAMSEEIMRHIPIEIIAEPDPKTDALIDIAYDCPTLEAAQRRAKEGLRQ